MNDRVEALTSVLTRRSAPGVLLRLAGAALTAWKRVANSRVLSYLVFLAMYAPPTIMLAGDKLLWDDEFFTLYLSTAKSWAELIRALATGADQHPPSFYWLTHLVTGAFGLNHVTLRLTAIVGFAVMCLCLYEIVGRMLNREWGFCAMLLPAATPFYWYSVESRGYGIQLGFVAGALLMWMLAGEGIRRRITIPLLALFLCGAVSSHYYALLALIGFGAGEATRAIVNRRIDWPVWLAFGAAAIPIAVFFAVIAKAQTYSGHFWAIPHWRSMASWYLNALGYALALPLGLSALAALGSALKRRGDPGYERRLVLWQVVGAIALAGAPVVAVIAAEFVTHAFTERYAICALPGVCILMTLGVARMMRHSSGGAAAVWALTAICFAGMAHRFGGAERGALTDLRETSAFLQASSSGPLAMADVTRFHRFSFYGRGQLPQRIVYLADGKRSIRYLGFDTVDRGLLALNPWFPINVRRMDEWVAEHPSFAVWGDGGAWSWLPQALPDLHAKTEFIAVHNGSMLLSVRELKIAPEERLPGDPPGRPMRYNEMRPQGRSLCELYMGARSCPAVE